ncbi:MAG: ABC transporter ATP-binding protein [Pseudomonadota bacterium]
MSDTPLLSINNIEAIYGGAILALRGVTLNVNKGEIVSLLGANGAGKTTTLKACSRLLEAERGEVTKGIIELNGEDISTYNAFEMVKQGVVQVLEGRHIFAHLNVEENLLTGSFIQNMSKEETKRNLDHVYELFPRIKERRKNPGGLCSGGEQQMIAVGRALMSKPSLILLDEPSMGLAPQFIEQIFEIVKRLNEEEGVSFLVSEQNAMVALRYAQVGYVIENGRVVKKGLAKQLLESSDVAEMYMGGGKDKPSFDGVKYYHRRRPCVV